MKKIINDPKNFVPEMLEGIYAAHPNEVTYLPKIGRASCRERV